MPTIEHSFVKMEMGKERLEQEVSVPASVPLDVLYVYQSLQSNAK